MICGFCEQDNGRAVFLAPGRYVLFSFFHNLIRRADINENLIKFGPITIVTVEKGHLGLSTKNGDVIILQPGRHILEAPHKYFVLLTTTVVS